MGCQVILLLKQIVELAIAQADKSGQMADANRLMHIQLNILIDNIHIEHAVAASGFG